MKHLYLFFIATLIFLGCKKETNKRQGHFIQDDPTILQDQYGRQVILHGLNTSASAKSDPQRQPWINESNVDREDKEFGFNSVRYLIFWDAIEPQKDSFDYAYLDKVEQRVNWYTSRGMHVVLDMHQDIYSDVFNGDGAPAWAVFADGYPINKDMPDGAWFLKNLDPAVVAALKNFWDYTKYKELQEHYILMWLKVLERFKNNPYVIGYDVMNEPYGGNILEALGDFEKTKLKKFYDRLLPALRKAEPNKYLFFEPQSLLVNSGVTSNLPKIYDTRTVPHLGYAPHFYPLFTEALPGPYDATARQNVKDCFNSRTKEMKLQNCPMLIGELGVSPSTSGFGDYLDDVHSYLDSMQASIAYYSNDHGGWSPLHGNGTETPILQHLIRTYPKAVAGRITKFRFDVNTKIFTLTYKTNAAITQPTEIFIPNRFYPNGWNLKVNGTSNYTQNFDATKQVLNFNTNENDKEITIEIFPK